MQYYDLKEEILLAKPSPLKEATESQLAKTRETYNVNEPQAKAIIAAVSSSGFTLIQGQDMPPYRPRFEFTALTVSFVALLEPAKPRRLSALPALCSPRGVARRFQFPGPFRQNSQPSRKYWCALQVTQRSTSWLSDSRKG